MTVLFTMLMFFLSNFFPKRKPAFAKADIITTFANFPGFDAFFPMTHRSSGRLTNSNREIPPPDSTPGTTSPATNCRADDPANASVRMFAWTYPSARFSILIELSRLLRGAFLPLVRLAMIHPGR